MGEQKIEDFINQELSLDDQKIALAFVDFLHTNEMKFIKDIGYWKDKIYYYVKFNDKPICFIVINDPDEKENRWTVWSDDMNSEWLEDNEITNEMSEIAWKCIDFCGNCGSCSGGKHKLIFGKEFDNVCGCTFKIDNPSADVLPFIKLMVQIRKKEILNLNK